MNNNKKRRQVRAKKTVDRREWVARAVAAAAMAGRALQKRNKSRD